MRTNIDIDDDLMEKAKYFSSKKTKKDIVQEALELYVTLNNQKKLLDLRGKIEFDDEAYR